MICRRLLKQRALLVHAHSGKADDLEGALMAGEFAERQRDQEYWLPLKQESKKLSFGK